MRRLFSYETKNRGTADFPAELYQVDIFHPRYAMPIHWHMECEIIYVSAGLLHLTMDGAEEILQAGDAAFLPAGVLHGAVPENCEYKCFVYDSERFFYSGAACVGQYRRWAETEGTRPFLFRAGTMPAETVQKLMQCMSDSSSTAREFRSTAVLWQLMSEIMMERGNTVSDIRSVHQTERVKDVLRKIRQDYGQNLSLDDLAKEAGMAPKYFCRLFREITGRTPIDYLNYYRVEIASELLYQTEKSVLDISIVCGFSDPSYFARIFKKYKGISASTYRKNSWTAEKKETI